MLQVETTSYRAGYWLRFCSGRGKPNSGTLSLGVAHVHCPRKLRESSSHHTASPLPRVNRLSSLPILHLTPLLSSRKGLAQGISIVQHPQWSRQVLSLVNGVITPQSQESREVSHWRREPLQLGKRVPVGMQSTGQKWPGTWNSSKPSDCRVTRSPKYHCQPKANSSSTRLVVTTLLLATYSGSGIAPPHGFHSTCNTIKNPRQRISVTALKQFNVKSTKGILVYLSARKLVEVESES